MALQRAMETTRPRSSRLFDDPLARYFLRGPLRAVADLATLPVAGRIVPVLYDLIWPGPRPSAVARTRLIDDTLAEALADGITQVVLLGAGFDSRAWRAPGPGRTDPPLAGPLPDGIPRVVLLGAVFDSRAWRLPAIGRACVIEVDRPETQQAKIAALRRTGQPLERARVAPVRQMGTCA